MPLQLVFHLELAKPSTVTAIWNSAENRLQVTKISGGGRLVEELRKHADEASITPGIFEVGPFAKKGDDEVPWTMLEIYDGFTDELKAGIDTVFSNLFAHLRIEQNSQVGKSRAWGEIRIFLTKPDGTYTKAWVWKDNLTWIQVIT